MASLKILSKPLNGKVLAQPSKSMAHRAIICAALANGETNIDNVVLSDDIKSTIGAVSSLGADISINRSKLYSGRMLITINAHGDIKIKDAIIDCMESGSTARFIMPISRLSADSVSFTGRGRLVERPFDIYENLFTQKGVTYSDTEGKMPIKLSGRLEPGKYSLPGDVSSQFVSGLLFTLPLLEDSSEINITGKMESIPYIQMTLNVLKDFGIEIVHEDDYRTFVINGRQSYKSIPSYVVEGDWSQAAFFCVMGAISGQIIIEGLNINSLQGDKIIVDILRNMGSEPVINGREITFNKSQLTGKTIDVSQCPDLVPAIALAASTAQGETNIINGARLRIKESDRLFTTSRELNILGADITEKQDGLIINGINRLIGGKCSGSEDHRIVMALAAASTVCDQAVEIEGYEAVKKSYPEFWEDFISVGGDVEFYG